MKHQVHAFVHRVPVPGVGLHNTQHLGLALIEDLAVVVAADGLEDGGGVPVAGVCYGGAVFGDLQRGKDGVGLTDGRLQRVTDTPRGAGIVGVVGGVGHVAVGLDQLDAGGHAQAEGMRILAHRVDAQFVADGVEEVIAGVAQRGGHIVLAVRPVLVRVGARAPDPALRRVAFRGVPCEDALALDLELGIDDALGQAGDRHTGLESGAGGVGAHQRTVEERRVRRCEQFGILFNDRGHVEGRPAGDGQRLAGLDVHHHDGGAGDLVFHLRVVFAGGGSLGAQLGAVLAHDVDAVGQDLLHLLLQGDVDRQIDVVPRLRVLQIDRGEDRAGGVSVLDDLAVLAVQVGLKGVLDAVLANDGVVGVIEQRVALELLLRHQPDIAQQMGRVRGAVVAGEGALDLDAVDLLLHDGGDQLHACVLDEHVVGGVDRVAHVDGVAHARDDAHLLGGVAVVDVIAGAHVAQELHGRGIVRQRLALVLEIGLQHGVLDLGHVVQILEGRLIADGQIVRIGVTVVAYRLHELKDRGVGVGVGKELCHVDLQVVAFLVAHKDAAVAVEDVPAGGGDGAGGLRQLVGAVVVGLALDDLQLIEEVQVDREQHGRDAGHRGESAGTHQSVFHARSFKNQISRKRKEFQSR